jgi:hypothetical protein
MIHGILQFTLRIAFRCVLHRCESQEIRCLKLFTFYNKTLSQIKRGLLMPGQRPEIHSSAQCVGEAGGLHLNCTRYH